LPALKLKQPGRQREIIQMPLQVLPQRRFVETVLRQDIDQRNV
jgi:hypothetical protein